MVERFDNVNNLSTINGELMITITIKELSEILGIRKSTLQYLYLSYYTLFKFVRTIKSPTGKRCQAFSLTSESINALEKYLLKKKFNIDGMEEIKEYYKNMKGTK